MDRKTAKRHAIVAGAVVALGLITVIITRQLDYPPEGFWDTYVVGFRGVGWMSMLVGAVWCGFSCLAMFTDYFDVERPISSEKYTMAISIVAVATIVLMVITVPNVTLIEDAKLSNDPNQRALQIKHRSNLKWLVALSLIAGGTMAASVPTRRFFRKA